MRYHLCMMRVSVNRRVVILVVLAQFLVLFSANNIALTQEFPSAESLTEEQKTEKRLLFSQYVEQELAQAQKKKNAQKREEESKIAWISRVSSSYGYDGNPNLTRSHDQDNFFKQTLEGSLKVREPLGGVFFTDRIGATWYTELLNYEHFELLNYHNSSVEVYSEKKLSDPAVFKLAYGLNIVQFYENHSLTYLGHKIKPTLTHNISQNLSHNIFASAEIKDFSSRKALETNAASSDKEREDLYYEAGYGIRLAPSAQTFIGVTGAWKLNNSNDLFKDYNDYSGAKVGGYIYQKLIMGFSTVAFGGYDHKHYTSRTFQDVPLSTESDDFFYTGGYLYFEVTKNIQPFISYLYKQNYSNDFLQEYSGYTISTGLNLAF